MSAYIMFGYLFIMLMQYIKIYTIDGFNEQTGRWKWYLNLPNVKLNENESVDGERYKHYLFKISSFIITLYTVLLLVVNFFFELTLTVFLVLMTLMVIDFTFFYHIKNKDEFKKDILL